MTYTGSALSKGQFSCAGCNLGMNSGVILSSGSVAAAAAPASSFSSVNTNMAGDAQLDALVSPLPTVDAAVLEFDVVPLFNKLEIKFIYASEEYPEYSTTGFFDPAAIYISGPGIAGIYNAAVLPSTLTPVNTNTVNNGAANIGPCTNCVFYTDNTNGTQYIYDGYTFDITSSINVQAGQTYHIKIAVADDSDHDFDTAILLEAGSLKSDSSTASPCNGFTADITSPDTICAGNTLSVTTSTPGLYIYNWKPANLFKNPTVQNPQLIAPVINQTIIAEVTDVVNGCYDSDTIAQTAYFNTTDSIIVCGVFNPFVLDAGSFPGASYSWTNGPTTQTNLASDTGHYYCTINLQGCFFVKTFVVVDTCTCNIVPIQDWITCNVSTLFATVVPSANYTYNWSINGVTYDTLPLFIIDELLINQPVIITITNPANGCTDSDTSIVTNIFNHTDSIYYCDSTFLSLPNEATNITWTFETIPPGNIITLSDTSHSIPAFQSGNYTAHVTYPVCGQYTYNFIATDTCEVQDSTDYFWVGSQGNWSDTAHWATTSGGNIHPPTSPVAISRVFFDVNSGLGAFDTVKVDVAFQFGDFYATTIDTLKLQYEIPSNTAYCYGSFGTYSPTLFLNSTGQPINTFIEFNSGGINNLIHSGSTVFGLVTFNGTGIWNLDDDMNCSTTLRLNSGTLFTNDKTLTFPSAISFTNSTTPKNLIAGNSIFKTWIWSAGNPFSNTDYHIQMDMDSATVIMDSASAVIDFAAETSQQYGLVQAKSFVQLTGNCNINNLTSAAGLTLRQGHSRINRLEVTLNDNISFHKPISFNSNDTLTINTFFDTHVSPGSTGAVTGSTNPPGSYIELLQGVACLDSLVISKITAIGNGTIYTGASSTDAGNNFNLQFAPCAPVTGDYYWVGGAGDWNDYSNHWANSSGGTTFHLSPPTLLDNVIFDANSFTQAGDSVYSTTPVSCKSFNASGINQAAIFSLGGNITVGGSMLLSSLITWNYIYTIEFKSDATSHLFASASINLDNTHLHFLSGTWTVLNDINLDPSLGTVTIDSGIVSFNNITVIAKSFYIYPADVPPYTVVNLGSSTLQLSAYYYAYSIPGFNTVINADSATVIGMGIFFSVPAHYHYVRSVLISGNASFDLVEASEYDVNEISADELRIGQYLTTYPHTYFINQLTPSVIGKLVIDASDTCFITAGKLSTEILFLNNPGKTVILDITDTLSINTSFIANSSAGNEIHLLNGMLSGNPVIYKGTGTVCLDYLQLNGIIAAGVPFNAGANSVDLGNNQGWTFTSCVNVTDVWPGDANSDLSVTNDDFLYIGLGYGYTGPVRSGASLNWIAQPANDWSGFFFNSANYKHADCNGDGVIDLNDSNAISLNYGLNHPPRNVLNPVVTNLPSVYLEASQDTIAINQYLNINIKIGTAIQLVDSIYGISFTVELDPTLIDTSQIGMIDYSSSIMGSYQTDLFAFEKHYAGSGLIEAATTRIDHNNVYNVFGTIGTFGIVTTDNIAVRQVLNLRLSNVHALSRSGDDIPLTVIEDSVLVDPTIGINNYV
ncbi:MAG: choice-of-anchor L domain-containing protein, partial [Bacteroidota bacterium]